LNLSEAFQIERGSVVAVVGAGGKTTLLLRLADELRSEGFSVAVTTTTKMGAAERIRASRTILADRLDDLLEGMANAFEAGCVPFLFSGFVGGKSAGLPPETVDRLRGAADVLLVEADGSRRCPLKFPRSFEPVVPESTNRLVVVLGAGGLGKIADEKTFFNLEGAGKILEAGSAITPLAVASALHDPRGYLGHCRPDRRTCVFVNQADAASDEEILDLTRALGHGAFHRIVTGSAGEPEPRLRVFENRNHRVAGAILAAGESKRFQGSKLTAPLWDRPMVRHVAESAVKAGLADILVVVGYDAGAVRASLDGIPGLRFVENARWEEGMGASIRAVALEASEFDGLLLLLGDQPFMGTTLIQRVLEEYRSCTAPLCFPMFDGRPGHPVLLRRELYSELRRLAGDRGARDVVKINADRARTFPLVDAGSQMDVDTRDDLRNAHEAH